MADFINTIDVLGDDAVIDSIINRTITEFKDDTLTSIGAHAFYECTALETVDLPNVTVVGGSAFQKCTTLSELSLPKVTTIRDYLIQGCSSLTKLCLPCLKTTAVNSLRDNSAVEIIDLPVCTKIEIYTFGNCGKLTTLLLRSATLCTLGGSSAFYNASGGTEWIGAGVGYIYVPRALLSDDDETKDYRRATNWSSFSSQFRALEDYTVDGTTTGELDETKI